MVIIKWLVPVYINTWALDGLLVRNESVCASFCPPEYLGFPKSLSSSDLHHLSGKDIVIAAVEGWKVNTDK